MDYSNLIGKVVTDCRRDHALVVSEIDPDVGISLHREGDETGKAVMCLVHPEVHIKRFNSSKMQDNLVEYIQYYTKSFEHWIDGITQGCLSPEWVVEDGNIDNEYGRSSGTQADIACPFK